jgi:hypothetical protein
MTLRPPHRATFSGVLKNKVGLLETGRIQFINAETAVQAQFTKRRLRLNTGRQAVMAAPFCFQISIAIQQRRKTGNLIESESSGSSAPTAKDSDGCGDIAGNRVASPKEPNVGWSRG